jgi:DNA polymerase-1
VKNTKKFLIVDGNSLAHRAFYALPLLTNRQGVFTNAVYGFTTMLLKILAKEKSDYLAVAFDKGKVTFRHAEYEEYKAQRKSTPVELRPQFSLIKEILTAMRISYYELENYEADDLIGTLTAAAEAQGLEIWILSGDKDVLQLVSPHTSAFLTKKGISHLDFYDLAEVKKKYGLNPKQLIDVKGLMGDPSDNIPGVPGVGKKTALKLIQEYNSLENLLDNIDRVSGKKLQENLMLFREQALMSKRLATIDCDAPLEFDLASCIYRTPDYSRLLALYKELEFNSLIKDVLEQMASQEQENKSIERSPGEISFIELRTPEDLEVFLQDIFGQGPLAFEVELDREDYLKGSMVSLGLAASGAAAGMEVQNESAEKEILSLLRPYLEDPERKWIFHDAKKTLAFLQKKGVSLANPVGDTLIGSYLLNPGSAKQDLAEISLEHLNRVLLPQEQKAREAAERAHVILHLHEYLWAKLKENEMLSLYQELEIPLVKVLSAMELTGVKLDQEQLNQMERELEVGIHRLTEEIYGLAGEKFNINSPKQLGVILFEKLGLPPLKKTKTGFSTNAAVLEELAPQHEIVAKILEFRQLVKLKTTYIDGLKELVDPATSRVHTTYNQTITATGRLSSTEPNLQNIPVRLEQGRLLRKAFIPSEEGVLIVSADYSQIELRVLAHMSGDKNLVDAFRKKQDIHARTAAEVFGVEIDQVTREMRRRAKAVNFGIVYGISDYGLARDLGISRKEAAQYIELYFSRYPGVKEYIQRVIQEGREKGYVTTLLKRRRYLPDLFSSNRNVRAFGERTAVNTPIQGSAADIIKLAMLRISDAFQKYDLAAKMILQVHDELIFEVPEKELKLVVKLIRDAMENALVLDVPLEVDLRAGPNWYQLEPID